MASSTKARREWIGSAIDQYQGRLIRFASRITGDVESARVVQDTFLRLCGEDLDRVRDHLPAWLFRVGEDEGGHRAELVTLIAQARRLSPNR